MKLMSNKKTSHDFYEEVRLDLLPADSFFVDFLPVSIGDMLVRIMQ